jgi:hypothetical protein
MKTFCRHKSSCNTTDYRSDSAFIRSAGTLNSLPGIDGRRTTVQEKTVTGFVENGDKEETGGAKDEIAPKEEAVTKEVPSAACDPTGVTYDDFLKQSGNIDDAFGLTRLSSSNMLFPAVALKKGVLEATSASMQVSSIYLQAQTFKDKGIVILPEDGGVENNSCPKGRYQRHWEITPSGATKIKEGEQEHCNDFILAFNNSLAVFRDAVNDASSKKIKFSSETAAKNYLKRKTKVHPDQWIPTFWCLAGKTKIRDTMNWHLPKFISPRVDKNCAKAVVRLQSMNLPEVGKHSSEEIIKDCEPAKKK